ncbi:MAG: hemerythrin domain-containing protein [Fimbriimonadia bacterium]|jgi:hemerythrin-like domain-containing protein
MRAIAELVEEHEAIRKMLGVLRVVAARVEAGEHVPEEDLRGIGEFFSVFADKCHHGKEEETLFPVLEQAGIPRDGGPIGVMLYEHTLGRSLVARIKGSVDGCLAGEQAARSEFASAANEYIALLDSHIAKENNVLFPMAESRLTPEQDAELTAAFEALERERIGEGVHEQLHGMIERLAQTYLA